MELRKKLIGLIQENGVDTILEMASRMKTHHENQVYVQAAEMFKQTQSKQIEKGAEKYPEPLNPQSWTVGQLAQHAFDELVDQSHYIAALKAKGEGLESVAAFWEGAAKAGREEVVLLRQENKRLERSCEEYAESLDRANESLEKAAKEIGELEMRSFQQSKDIEYLDERVGVLKNIIKSLEVERCKSNV